jgi:hypothetical protein
VAGFEAGVRKSGMTRFKEQSRIELAIEHGDRVQLTWAAGYCRMRLRIATRKDHQKYWRKMEQKVQKALENSK